MDAMLWQAEPKRAASFSALDANGPGDDGAKETLWRMHEKGIDAYLVWSRRKLAGKYADREPESLTAEEWADIAG